MKRIATLLIAVLLLAGCKVNAGTYEKIQKMLTNLESYRMVGTVEYISNRGSNIYSVIQHASITGEYRVEVTAPEPVSGSITIFDGKTIAQYSTKYPDRLITGNVEAPERSEIFLTSFIKNYLNSDNVSVTVSGIGADKYTVLEAIIPGEHPFLSSEKLWVDNSTLKPVKLVVFDPQGTERIVVKFTEFDYNIPLDKTLFEYKR